MKQITVTVHEDGTVSAEADGFQGVGCLEALREVLGGLGDEKLLRPKPEYFQVPKREEKWGVS